MAIKNMRSWDEYRQINFYDCFQLDDQSSTRLFGNRNVGNMNLTNLQVAGTVLGLYDHDQYAVLHRWYARTEIEPSETRQRWFENTHATFLVGSRLTWQLSLADLILRRPRYVDDQHQQVFDQFPIVIPPRQNISVTIDMFTRARDHLMEHMEQVDAGNRKGGIRTWIHFEGVIAPANDVLPLFDAMYKKTRTIEERVSHYILGRLSGDEASDAQLHALSDAVLEGRHRW